jgi:hypothetical protein
MILGVECDLAKRSSPPRTGTSLRTLTPCDVAAKHAKSQ